MDDDVPVEHPVAVLIRDSLVELAARTAWGDVFDEDRMVVVLVASGQVETIQADLGAFALKEDPYLVSGDPRSERDEV
jgi:hypothetical protein